MSAHNLLQQLAVAPFAVKDPGDSGTISVDRWGMIVPVVTVAAEPRTLAAPLADGLQVTICLRTDGGDLTLTVTDGYNAAGDTTIVFDDAGDWVTLQSEQVGSDYRWRIVAQEGTDAAITVANLTATALTATAAEVATLNAPTVTAEHAAGAVGTGVAPTTTRRVENGTIITEIKLDLTGLASVAAANDIIGLAASTPPAYVGRNVLANNGVIYRVEMICLETPAAGDDDINLVAGSAADEHVDDAVTGAAVILNAGDQAAGMVTVSNAPKITADHYFYLTAGTGGAATYTAGQLIIRLYGHALLA